VLVGARWWKRMRVGLVATGLALACCASPVTAAAPPDYATAPFAVTTHPYAFGQAPTFMPDGRNVLFGKDFRQGDGMQVYTTAFDGSDLRCLTCGGPGPNDVNNVPVPRPQGDWVLYHSWRGHQVTIGSPGYGGLGSALWIMRPDGSHQTQLTEVAPPGSVPGTGEGYDDYHAYWSPDGRRIVFAHLNWDFVNAGGQGKWDVRVADFVDDASGPHLANVRVVRPANGHWYETQWWAPDGSGFLYTETSGTAVNPELFFCRLTDSGCDVTQLTHNAAWDEQAIFTPDMKDVLFMSSRDHPGFFNTFSQTAQAAGLTTDEDYLLILPIFEAGFLQPVGQEATDLYDLNLATGSVRRLTTFGDDGGIVPEFTWDPANRFLMWTENRLPDGYRYPLPPDALTYIHSLQALLEHPPDSPLDPSPNGVGVAPVPVQQTTRIGRFDLRRRAGS
jgi:Tol biopolymer transport system component